MDTQQKNSLLPCPFCGNENPSDGFPYIMCDSCGAFGPDPKDGRSGVELWNQRRGRAGEGLVRTRTAFAHWTDDPAWVEVE